MPESDIRSLDLNLLSPLEALLRHRHVSRAAAAVHITQPAMSRALARLRRALGDELITRIGQGYELTPRGEQLSRDLAVVMPELERALTGQPFDPAVASCAYRVTAADSMAALLGPALFRAVRQGSPRSTLQLTRWHDQATDDLDRGLTDLVIRAVAPPGSLRSEAVLTGRFVCVVAAHHPLAAGDHLTLSQYLRYEHIAVDLSDGKQSSIDERLSALTRSRIIALTTPSHAIALAAVPSTQLVATLPELFLNLAPPDAAVRVLRAPAEIEPLNWVMIWHPRTSNDPAQQWLRAHVRATASQLA